MVYIISYDDDNSGDTVYEETYESQLVDKMALLKSDGTVSNLRLFKAKEVAWNLEISMVENEE